MLLLCNNYYVGCGCIIMFWPRYGLPLQTTPNQHTHVILLSFLSLWLPLRTLRTNGHVLWFPSFFICVKLCACVMSNGMGWASWSYCVPMQCFWVAVNGCIFWPCVYCQHFQHFLFYSVQTVKTKNITKLLYNVVIAAITPQLGRY